MLSPPLATHVSLWCLNYNYIAAKATDRALESNNWPWMAAPLVATPPVATHPAAAPPPGLDI